METCETGFSVGKRRAHTAAWDADGISGKGSIEVAVLWRRKLSGMIYKMYPGKRRLQSILYCLMTLLKRSMLRKVDYSKCCNCC